MKLPGQDGNPEEVESRMGNTFGNGSNTATSTESQSLDIEQSGSTGLATGPRTKQGKQTSSRNATKHGLFSKVILLKGESRAEYEALLAGLREARQPKGTLEENRVEKLATLEWRQRRLLMAERAEIRKGVDFMQWDQQTREQKEEQEIDRSSGRIFQGGLISGMDNPHVFKRCLALLTELRESFVENGFTKNDTVVLNSLYGDRGWSRQGFNLYKQYNRWLFFFAAYQANEEKCKAQGIESPEQCKSKVLKAIDKEIRRLKKHQKAQVAIESERMKVEAMRRAVPESPALDRLLRYEASLDRSFERTLNQLERLQRARLGQPVPPQIDLNISSS